MMGIPTCQDVTALLTDLDEGALGPFLWAGVRVHLGLCPPCRAFLRSLRRTPSAVRGLLREETGVPSTAELAFAGALDLLRRGRLPEGPALHPDGDAWEALAPAGDPLAAILLRVHLGWCGACRARHGADQALEMTAEPVSASLRELLPPERDWRWTTRGLGGGRLAELATNPDSGSSLNLVQLPPGRTFPTHRHLGNETTVLLGGSLRVGPAHLRPGDWLEHGVGTVHAPEADPGAACWALVRLGGPVQFIGWRRFLV
ncbi:MAG TPA: cupin domain-containing protein [Holophagaceae bacterium]